jgi:hypothetical protein
MKQTMNRTASDNAYLHKDFHAALSVGLMYIEDNYRADAVRDYLRQFAAAFYGPLQRDILQRGLAALQEHYARIYQLEGGEVTFNLTGDTLTIDVAACPAVMHMRQNGRPVSPLFFETTRTVNEAICEGTPFRAELLAYDAETGRSTVRFSRRQP